MLEDFKLEQPIVYKILSSSIKNNSYSHAYVFETNGYSKSLNIALAFSKALLCPKNQISGENCVNCTQCKIIDDGNFLELNIIEADGTWIKKGQLEELQEIFSKKPLIGNKKIYIIKDANKMNDVCSNSLLKFLEEPQEGIIAILIVENSNQLLNTIKSRCQVLPLKKNKIDTNKTMMNMIGEYLFNNEEQVLEFVSNESMIEKVNTIVEFVKYYEINGEKTILFINKLWNNYFQTREDYAFAFSILLLYYKDVLNYIIGRDLECFFDSIDSIKKISNMNSVESLSNKIKLIAELKDLIKYNVNLGLLMDKLIIKLKGCDIDD